MQTKGEGIILRFVRFLKNATLQGSFSLSSFSIWIMFTVLSRLLIESSLVTITGLYLHSVSRSAASKSFCTSYMSDRNNGSVRTFLSCSNFCAFVSIIISSITTVTYGLFVILQTCLWVIFLGFIVMQMYNHWNQWRFFEFLTNFISSFISFIVMEDKPYFSVKLRRYLSYFALLPF